MADLAPTVPPDSDETNETIVDAQPDNNGQAQRPFIKIGGVSLAVLIIGGFGFVGLLMVVRVLWVRRKRRKTLEKSAASSSLPVMEEVFSGHQFEPDSAIRSGSSRTCAWDDILLPGHPEQQQTINIEPSAQAFDDRDVPILFHPTNRTDSTGGTGTTGTLSAYDDAFEQWALAPATTVSTNSSAAPRGSNNQQPGALAGNIRPIYVETRMTLSQDAGSEKEKDISGVD